MNNSLQVPRGHFLIKKRENTPKFIENSIKVPRGRFLINKYEITQNTLINSMKNLRDNCFNVCMRGAGNFSYRLYETMMMGRIPIIINSDQVFPFGVS